MEQDLEAGLAPPTPGTRVMPQTPPTRCPGQPQVTSAPRLSMTTRPPVAPPLGGNVAAKGIGGKGASPAAPPPPKGAGRRGSAGPVAPPPAKGVGKGVGKSAVGGRVEIAAVEPALGMKLRPIQWKVLLPRDVPETGSIWNELDMLKSKFEDVDTTKFERAFEKQEENQSKGKNMAAQQEKKQNLRRVPPETIDNKTWQNLAIAFSRLASKPDVLLDKLLSLDDFPEGLSPQELKNLVDIVSDETKAKAIQVVRKWDLSISQLESIDKPERVLWVLAHVPHIHAKLQCGALVYGSAQEQIAEARMAAERICAFCSRFRSSRLLREVVGNALRFGNLLNYDSGGSRAGAPGIALPESLLKLSEMRATKGTMPIDASAERRELSVLDFVAEALASSNDGEASRAANASTDRPKSGAEICLAEAEALLNVARPCLWGPVTLDEAGSSTANVRAKAAQARLMLEKVPLSDGVVRLAERVRSLCEEVIVTAKIVTSAKAELISLQKWSTMRLGVKEDEWFRDWAFFFDQLVCALDRVRGRASKPTAALSTSHTAASSSDAMLTLPDDAVHAHVTARSESAPTQELMSPDHTPCGAVDGTGIVILPSPCRTRPRRSSIGARAAMRLRQQTTGLDEDSDCQSDVSDF